MTDVHRRLREIEDRKIELLMELSEMNQEYEERVTILREEYAELDSEHYLLKLRCIRGGRSPFSHPGDGET